MAINYKNNNKGTKLVHNAKILHCVLALALIGAAVLAFGGCGAEPDDEGVSNAGGGGTTYSIVILKNPVSPKDPYSPGAPAETLTVEAQIISSTGGGAPDGVTLTYQWYSQDVGSSSEPAELRGETNPYFTPRTGSIGATFYSARISASDGSILNWSSRAMVAVSDSAMIIITGGNLNSGAYLENTDGTTVPLTSVVPGPVTYYGLKPGVWTLKDYTPDGKTVSLTPPSGTLAIGTNVQDNKPQSIVANVSDNGGNTGTIAINVGGTLGSLPETAELVGENDNRISVEPGSNTYTGLASGVWELFVPDDEVSLITNPNPPVVYLGAGETKLIAVLVNAPDSDGDGYPDKWEIAHENEGYNPNIVNTPYGLDLSHVGAVPPGVTFDNNTYTIRNEGSPVNYRVFQSNTSKKPVESINLEAGAEGILQVRDNISFSLSSAGAAKTNVLVASGVTNATITLNGVTLNGGTPVQVAPGAKATLLLSGNNNTLSAGGSNAAVNVPPDAELVIDSASGTGNLDGKLTANGGDAGTAGGGAGIGGNKGQSAGKITINGGYVNAAGGTGDFPNTATSLAYSGGGAGIGAGGNSFNPGSGINCGAINITGGSVEAQGGNGAAGIGGGSVSENAGGSIDITGGEVCAWGGKWGAGIGGGTFGGANITISDGTVYAYSVNWELTNGGSAAIGGGGFDGNPSFAYSAVPVNIDITGGVIAALASYTQASGKGTKVSAADGAGIGTGSGNGADCTINISGGTIMSGSASGDGIGLGAGTSESGEVEVTVNYPSGTAVVLASSIANSESGGENVSYDGPATDGGSGVLKGVELFLLSEKNNNVLTKPSDATIKEGTANMDTLPTLTVPNSYTLTVPKGWTLDLKKDGAITNNGTIHGNCEGGNITNNGTIQGGTEYGDIIGEGSGPVDTSASINLTTGAYTESMVSYENNRYTIRSPGSYEVSGSTTTDGLYVNKNVTGVQITLNNASIDISGSFAPLDIGGDSEVTLLLRGNNLLKTTAQYNSAIYITSDNDSILFIDSADSSDAGTETSSHALSGVLRAVSGDYGAAIGGVGDSGTTPNAGGNIAIFGGTVVAYAHGRGAGIGGGSSNTTRSTGGAGGTLRVKGGMVIAASAGGAGIGGGFGAMEGGAGGEFTISGGAVVAFSQAENGAVGIGGGNNANSAASGGAGGTVALRGGTLFAISKNGNGIGGGASENGGYTGAAAVISDSLFNVAVGFVSSLSATSQPTGTGILVGTKNLYFTLPNWNDSKQTFNETGEIILRTGYTVPTGGALIIPIGCTFDIKGQDFGNNGTIYYRSDKSMSDVPGQKETGDCYGWITDSGSGDSGSGKS